MESLKRIESLPAGQKSSRIGQAGVLNDLRAMPTSDAIAWLEKHISSPVTSDWGSLLSALNADWLTLKTWMHKSKEHALAAADAICSHVVNHGELPKATTAKEIEVELLRLVSLYETPRLQKAQKVVHEFLNPAPLSKGLKEVAQILFGSNAYSLGQPSGDKVAQWQTIMYKADGCYCLAIVDWKAPEAEQRNALSSLPILKQDVKLTIEEVDLGSDEIVFVVLPQPEMDRLKTLAPSGIRFKPSRLKSNHSFNGTA